MDREAGRAAVHGITESRTQLSDLTELSSIRDYWKNHSADYMDLCWQNNVSAF